MLDLRSCLSVKEVAEQLGYSGANVTSLIRSGKIKAIRRGRKYFISPEDIKKYLVGCGNAPDSLS